MSALSSPLGRVSAPSPLTLAERETAERRMWDEQHLILVVVGDLVHEASIVIQQALALDRLVDAKRHAA